MIADAEDASPMTASPILNCRWLLQFQWPRSTPAPLFRPSLIRWNVDKFRHPSNRPSQSENLRRDLRTAYRLVAREDELASGPASLRHESRAAVMRAFWVRCCRRTSKHLCGPRRTLLHRVE